MALISLKVRLPADPDPANSPPDAEEEYPPYKLIFTNTDTHILDDPVTGDYIPTSLNTSFDRWMRLEASGLTSTEIVDNIKIWCEDLVPEDTPDELREVAARSSIIVTNCTVDTGDYYGSSTYQDSMYSKQFHLPTSRPATSNVGIEGNLFGEITQTSQPGAGIPLGGVSDWILLQATKTQELIDLITSQPTLARYLFQKNIQVEWDNYGA